MKKNNSELEKIGLTRNESVTYLTLLQIGTSRTGELLKKSGLNSGKIYEILESLKHKGLVSEVVRNNVKEFSAAPPEQLYEYVKQKKDEISRQEKIIEKIIPSLTQIRKETLPQKRIVTYAGFRGIITAAEEALETTPEGEEILSLGINDINAWSQKYWIKWENMREKKKISGRYILSQRGKIYRDLESVRNVQVKIMELDTPVGIDIYGKNIVLILHYQEPISCTLIYDENTATTLRSYFEPLWKLAR